MESNLYKCRPRNRRFRVKIARFFAIFYISQNERFRLLIHNLLRIEKANNYFYLLVFASLTNSVEIHFTNSICLEIELITVLFKRVRYRLNLSAKRCKFTRTRIYYKI